MVSGPRSGQLLRTHLISVRKGTVRCTCPYLSLRHKQRLWNRPMGSQRSPEGSRCWPEPSGPAAERARAPSAPSVPGASGQPGLQAGPRLGRARFSSLALVGCSGAFPLLRAVPATCPACAERVRTGRVRASKRRVLSGASGGSFAPVGLAAGESDPCPWRLGRARRCFPPFEISPGSCQGTRAGRLGAHWTARWPSGRSWVRTSTLCRLVGGTGLSAGQRAGSRQASSAGQPCST